MTHIFMPKYVLVVMKFALNASGRRGGRGVMLQVKTFITKYVAAAIIVLKLL